VQDGYVQVTHFQLLKLKIVMMSQCWMLKTSSVSSFVQINLKALSHLWSAEVYTSLIVLYLLRTISSGLDDRFHLMNHPNIPIKHEAEKGYKNALENTFFVWNSEKMNVLVEPLKVTGKCDEEVKNMQYFHVAIFHDCEGRIVPPPKTCIGG